MDETLRESYILLVLDNWKLIAAVTFLAVVATYILTKTVMTKWYQATAVIEPIPEGAVENRVEGGMGGLGGAGMSTFLMVYRHGFPGAGVSDHTAQFHLQYRRSR